MVAALIRLTGDWDLAEDCVQDAVERALVTWPRDGLPDSPAAWLTTAARNRALDVLRRRRTERAKLQEHAIMNDLPGARSGGSSGGPRSGGSGGSGDPGFGGPGSGGAAGSSMADPATAYDDDRLRLIFTCCHPALPLEGRVALTLKSVAGLSTAEIARAFLVSEPTMSQRLLRTKRKIEHARIPYRVPSEDRLAERVGGVLAVLYLVVNEAYGRAEDRLLAEALALVRLLVDLMPGEDEARGLLALVTLQAARRTTRFDAAGELVPMEEQNRSRWDRALLDEGLAQLRRAENAPRPPGAYRLQARIAALHAVARTPEETDWRAIVRQYDLLLAARPSPVIALNRAIAVGFRDGFDAGLAELDALTVAEPTALAGYYLLPATRADLLRRLGRSAEAAEAYRDAIALAPEDGPERRFLERRLTALDLP